MHTPGVPDAKMTRSEGERGGGRDGREGKKKNEGQREEGGCERRAKNGSGVYAVH